MILGYLHTGQCDRECMGFLLVETLELCGLLRALKWENMKFSVRGKVIFPHPSSQSSTLLPQSPQGPLCDVCVQGSEDLSCHLCGHYPLNPGCLRLPSKVSARKALRQKTDGVSP